MKVIDQLIFLGQLHGLDATTASKRAHVWCERMEITEAIPKKTEELSKGMQQKIQFIAALLHEPELIIMDEPFSGLDPVNAVLLMDTLVDLRKQGRSVLFSTHRMDQVEKLCDAICLIHNGTPRPLRRHARDQVPLPRQPRPVSTSPATPPSSITPPSRAQRTTTAWLRSSFTKAATDRLSWPTPSPRHASPASK